MNLWSKLPALLPTLTAFLALAASPSATERTADMFLTDQAVVLPRAAEIIDPSARAFLTDRDGSTVRAWVFFTDKGITARDGFVQQATAVNISDKVLRRRAKVNRARVLFVDLPVDRGYVDAVGALGAAHRRTSKWLNAASFEIPVDRLDAIAALPYVAEIRPLATFKTDSQAVETAPRELPSSQLLESGAIAYGYAQAQVEQINVPPVHEKGYSGAGVTLAIFDTGYRKSHASFSQHYIDGRVLAEWDFINDDGETANETANADWGSQWNHGTYIWSTSGGLAPGYLVGPAYGASFLLAKTEDVRSETPVEEDNWIAALEWADSLGADVITSSLSYSDWYTVADLDGQTAAITIAANTAAGLGIVVCNSMGNSGPSATTLTAPADAFEILAVGAVDQNGLIAGFSSRGPTYDGRTKPEVVARGVSTSAASASSDGSYTTVSGTSLSTPLVAGAVCLLIEARPEFPPQLIRQALMETADRSGSPDNDYGWGLINVDSALTWGINFTGTPVLGDAPQMVNFSNLSTLPHSYQQWLFGDGVSSTATNPSHMYTEAGAYDVSLTITTDDYGDLASQKLRYVVLLGDTLSYGPDSVFAGSDAVLSVNLTNSQSLNRILVPFTYENNGVITYDSISLGDRTSYFEQLRIISQDTPNRRFVAELTADIGGGAPLLEKGSGEVMRIHFSTDLYGFGGQSAAVDSFMSTYEVTLTAPYLTYEPDVHGGSMVLRPVLRGDVENSMSINVGDVTYMVANLFQGGPPPVSIQAGDANRDFFVNVGDLTYLVAYLFQGGPEPPTP